MKHKSLDCIYSRQALSAERISLDHYLPWSFVVHDQLWNLVPVVPEVNSSKSNGLPAQQYFNSFVAIQHLGLTTVRENLSEKAWENYMEPFISDLRIGLDELLELESLRNVYLATIEPLTTLAAKQGFSNNWVYEEK